MPSNTPTINPTTDMMIINGTIATTNVTIEANIVLASVTKVAISLQLTTVIVVKYSTYEYKYYNRANY